MLGRIPTITCIVASFILIAGASVAPAQDSQFTPIATVDSGQVGEMLFVEGKILSHRTPWNDRAPHILSISDGTGDMQVVFWDDSYDSMAAKGKLLPSALIAVYGEVDEYQGNVQLKVDNPEGIRLVKEAEKGSGVGAAPSGGPVSIGDINAGMAGAMVSFSGTADSVREPTSPTGPYIVEVNDGTGTTQVVFWQDFFDQLGASDKPASGVTYDVKGEVDIFRDSVQIKPGSASDFKRAGGNASAPAASSAASPASGGASPFAGVPAATASPFGGGSNAATAAATAPAPSGGSPFSSANSGSSAPSPFSASNSAAPASPFGGSSSAASASPFGGSSSASSSAPATPFGGSSSSASSSVASASPSPFGGGSSSTTAAAPSPFGGSSASAPAPAPAVSPSPFGGGTSSASSAAPTPFGSTTAAPAPQPSSPFGSPGSRISGSGTPFGSAAPASGGAVPFGSTPSTTGFGSQPSAPAPSPFSSSSASASAAAAPAEPSPFRTSSTTGAAPAADSGPSPFARISQSRPEATVTMAKDSAPAAAPAGTKATPTKPFGEGAVAVNSILPQDAGKTRAVAGTIQGAFTSSHGTLMKVRDDSGHIDVFLMKAAVKKLPREQRNLLKNGNRIHLNAPVKKFKGRAELRITKTAQIIDVRPAE